ncbi:inositol 2-dehydrogenase [Fonticella tunisiensis]|uniref:Myo-inositol 2-dehydrogenase/D-chiro-inositol 1-dehydrogenase n=1 Tax=Fonticella tunisiensis TaxID=1096341 RepID=A0A4R7KNS6_9CLOT|nr:inositol 2-dehydrogenase [Fonticella tunisiensis]TDT56502.1 myo-inositol 2-dehydrogenase/D-chiro-inositol 1-dehydrogenase [Fonticella tunisiensis]
MKKVRIGIVGLGRLGKKHAENIAFRIPNAELVAACSIVKEEVEDVQRNWGIKYGYTDFSEMLKNDELDAIFIASSSTEHCRQIEEALKAGYHVFSEKPLGVNMEEVIRAKEIVEQHQDKVFMLGFMRRYDASYAYAKKKIEEGAIGKPFLIRCYGLDPVKAVKGAIAFSEKSGGLFLDMAIHDIDLARWYLGSEAKSVYAVGSCYAYPEFKKYNDADNGAALIQFQNDAIGMFYAGRTCAHGYHIETEIIGTEGSLRIGTVPQKNLVTIFDEKGAVQECVSGFLERFEQAYVAEVQEFVNCILENRKPGVVVDDGVKSTEIAYACKESFEKNKLVFLNE